MAHGSWCGRPSVASWNGPALAHSQPLSRVLKELDAAGLIEVGGVTDRRKSNRYILHFVDVPAHVIKRTLDGVAAASKAVENSPKPSRVRATETVAPRATETVAESYQSNLLNEERGIEGRGTA